MSQNYIKCRFCAWTTRKWGRKSNPTKACARLAGHIEDAHPHEGERFMGSAGPIEPAHIEELYYDCTDEWPGDVVSPDGAA